MPTTPPSGADIPLDIITSARSGNTPPPSGAEIPPANMTSAGSGITPPPSGAEIPPANMTSAGSGNTPPPSGADMTRKEKFKEVLLVTVQLLACAATIIFGIWAPLSFNLQLKFWDDQRIATNLSYAGLEEQRYSRALSEQSIRWSKYAYDLALAALRAELIGLCKDHPDLNMRICDNSSIWTDNLSAIVGTYFPNVTVPPGPPNPFPEPRNFTPPGYPLSFKSVTQGPSMFALTGVSIAFRDEAALTTLRQTSVYVSVLRDEHPDTLTSMNNLAFTLKGQGCNGETISLIEKCFQLRKRILSPQHPWTTSSLKTLKECQVDNKEISV
ncbi:hypothetical protein GQ44DRAFT_725249 [Phaeosphaeriaceae sp. PMI808]|nr:hypothetical protein GQ44DRAFT_725249 [Phaeosphaeriaceae sp. PMI808]